MKLYLISQEVNNTYDTYDSAVVCAESAEEAQKMHPNGADILPFPEDDIYYYHTWTQLENVQVKEIGLAHPNITKGVILASFNAG